MSRGALQSAWLRALVSHPWEVFLTLTFSSSRTAKGISAEHADNSFRRLIQFVNEELYGRRWLRKSKHKGVVWIRVEEGHRDGILHYHACIYSPTVQISPTLIRRMRSWWRSRFGAAAAEIPKSKLAVLRYLLKTLTREQAGELDPSWNFPKFT